MLVQSCHACSHIFPNPCHFLIVSTDKMEHLENGTSIFIVLLLVLPSRNWPMPSPRQVHLTMDVIKCYKICKCQKPNSNKRQEGVCVCVCVWDRERERERERVNNNLNPQLPSQLQSRSISRTTNPQIWNITAGQHSSKESAKNTFTAKNCNIIERDKQLYP
jgi:hypothetical protein